MSTEWVAPLAVSAGVVFVLTPIARQLARRIGLVDRPAPHKAHRRVTPYLGGIAIAAGVIAGRLTEPATKIGSVTTILAALLAVMGLVDDDRTLPPLPRLLIEFGCAIAVVAAGLKIVGTGVPGLDAVVTVLLFVGVTNATNLMDNLDGLAAGVTAAGAAGAGLLAWLGGHGSTVADAASLVGACLAFLVFNARPASIFMGDAGSLFLGFLLMAVAIRAGQPLEAPASLVVPLLIVALPIADTVTVFLGRLRHGRSPLRGGRDHLSHRLAGTGLGSGRAVVVLIGVEGAMAALAVAAGRHRIPLWLAAAAGALIILALVVVAARVRVYPELAVPLPRLLVWGVPGVVIVIGVLAVPSALGMVRAHRPVLAAETELENALAAAHGGRLSQVTSDLAAARQQLQQARADLHGPLMSAGLAYPVLSSNLAAARRMVDTGLTLSDLGGQLTALRQDLHMQVEGGTLPLQPMEHAAAGLRLASASVDRSTGQVSHLSRTYLIPSVAHALDRFEADVGPARRDLSNAAAIATNLPDMLGAHGPRTYFLAVQNPDESRGTGGLIGNWGVLVANQGHVQIGAFAREEQLDSAGSSKRSIQGNAAYLARYSIFDPAQNWQNVNMSPDFPTVGSVIADLYPQSGGTKIDGVIAVDPATLQALLQLTGPVAVSGWPVPIAAGNVVHVTLYDAYNSFTNETQRADFLSNVAHAAFSAFQNLPVTDVSSLVSALGPVAHQGDVMVYSTHPGEEAFLQQVGVAGAVPAVQSGSLDVVTQNVAANKIDYFLHRSIDYRATIIPDGSSTAQTSVDLSVSLDNTAPPDGLPPSLIGPYSPQFQPGEEATYLSVYSPLEFESARLNGSPASMSSARELDRHVYSDFIDIYSGKSATLEMSLAGPVALLPGGWYRLDLPHQPSVNPDEVTVAIEVAPGWQITGVRGATQKGLDLANAHFVQTAEDSVWVRVAPAPGR